MTTLRITIDCPHCAGEVEHVNGTANGSLSVAILACTSCARQWEVCTRITPHAASRALDSKRMRAQRDRVRR